MPGQILGDRYEVEKQLGRKSGRWTLLARDLQTEEPVILKILCTDDEMLPDDLKLFQREVETLQTLTHPALPKYLGYFEIDLPKAGKALALIQSYLEGTSLNQYLQQGRRLTETEAKQIAQAVLEILDYLHDHNPPLLHRDIKPGNVLLANPDEAIASRVYLVDLGSVKAFTPTDSQQTSLTVIGTNGYMPPEQIGRRAVRASDLYSLGATLITAMTGIEPVDLLRRGGTCIDVEQVIRASPAFVDWLKHMTEPELSERFSTTSEAFEALMQTI
jgi:eukaryotic-like serine/threonine-protein kinase